MSTEPHGLQIERVTAERDAAANVIHAWTAAVVAMLNHSPHLARLAAEAVRRDAAGQDESARDIAERIATIIESYGYP